MRLKTLHINTSRVFWHKCVLMLLNVNTWNNGHKQYWWQCMYLQLTFSIIIGRIFYSRNIIFKFNIPIRDNFSSRCDSVTNMYFEVIKKYISKSPNLFCYSKGFIKSWYEIWNYTLAHNLVHHILFILIIQYRNEKESWLTLPHIYAVLNCMYAEGLYWQLWKSNG